MLINYFLLFTSIFIFSLAVEGNESSGNVYDKDFVAFLKFTKRYKRQYRNLEEFVIRYAVYLNTVMDVRANNRYPYSTRGIHKYSDCFEDERPTRSAETNPRPNPIPNTTPDEKFISFFSDLKENSYWKSRKFINFEDFLLGFKQSLGASD